MEHLKPTLPARPTSGALSAREMNAEQAAKVGEVARMLGQLGDRSENPHVTATGYVFACGSASHEAIAAAARRFASGEVEGHNRAFPPNTAEFAAEVRRLDFTPADRARGRIAETMAMLDARERPEPSEESKARVQASADDFAARVRRNHEDEAAQRAQRSGDPYAKYRTKRPEPTLEASTELEEHMKERR